MRPGPAILSAALSAALLASGLADCPAQSAGERPSGPWIDEAVRLSSAGRWADAGSLLDQALSLYPADSDLLYLRALSRAKSGRPLGEALADAAASRATDDYALYADRDAAVLQAEILVRMRRWREGLEAASSASGLASDPALRLIRAKAFAGSGDRAAFIDEIRYSIDRFPDDPAFPRLYLSRLQARPISDAERSLGEHIASRAGRYADSDPELSVLAAPLMARSSDRENAILAFRALGRSSAAATLEALEYGLIDEAKAISESFDGAFAQRVDSLYRLAALMRTPEARGKLAQALATWSGAVEADRDGDGVVEERFELDRGLVAAWRIDRDQDAAFELSAAFEEGLPSSIEHRIGALRLRVEYDAFPYLSRVRFDDSSGSHSYSFGPGALAYAPLRMRLFIGEGRQSVYLPEPIDIPSPTETACAAAALGVRRSGADLAARLIDFEEATLLRGVPQSARAYRAGRLYSTTDYERGHPAVERADEDGDGRFEIERGYAPGGGSASALAWTRIDTDGDGVFDYREEAAPPYRKEWDYDGDGTIDAAQYALPDGSVRAEFSSRVDGRLDEAVTVRDGRVAELRRDGKPIALIPDANPAIVWIGAKSFDLGSDLPPGEGFFRKSGVRYRIVRVGSIFFAEVLP